MLNRRLQFSVKLLVVLTLIASLCSVGYRYWIDAEARFAAIRNKLDATSKGTGRESILKTVFEREPSEKFRGELLIQDTWSFPFGRSLTVIYGNRNGLLCYEAYLIDG